jgi:hypothetical protein
MDSQGHTRAQGLGLDRAVSKGKLKSGGGMPGQLKDQHELKIQQGPVGQGKVNTGTGPVTPVLFAFIRVAVWPFKAAQSSEAADRVHRETHTAGHEQNTLAFTGISLSITSQRAANCSVFNKSCFCSSNFRKVRINTTKI